MFVHGAAVNGDLWRKVVPELAAGHRCITLDVPLGGHSIPLDGEPDLSLFGVARIVADFLEALDLERRDRRGQRHRRRGLAGARGPPPRAGRPARPHLLRRVRELPAEGGRLPAVARARPGSFRLVGHALRLRPLQRLPITYGWASHRPIDPRDRRLVPEPACEAAPACGATSRACSRAADPRDTVAAAELLRSFDKPALVVWAADDRFFPREHGRRLAELLPQGRFELVERLAHLHPGGQPRSTGRLLRRFL